MRNVVSIKIIKVNLITSIALVEGKILNCVMHTRKDQCKERVVSKGKNTMDPPPPPKGQDYFEISKITIVTETSNGSSARSNVQFNLQIMTANAYTSVQNIVRRKRMKTFIRFGKLKYPHIETSKIFILQCVVKKSLYKPFGKYIVS